MNVSAPLHASRCKLILECQEVEDRELAVAVEVGGAGRACQTSRKAGVKGDTGSINGSHEGLTEDQHVATGAGRAAGSRALGAIDEVVGD